MVAVALAIGTLFFVVFGWLSDKIGRKPVIMLACARRAHLLPAVQALTWAGNPALAQAQARSARR